MKTLVIALSILLTSPTIAAQGEELPTLGEVSRWRLSTEHGEVAIELFKVSKSDDNDTVLSLEPNGEFIPTVEEETSLLRQVFHDMSLRHYDPRDLVMINTWLQKSEYLDGVEHAVSQSNIVKACNGLKYCHAAEPIAAKYLASVDAFNGFDTVLREYGLTKKSVSIDDMGATARDGKVLCGGLIVISLQHAE